VRYSIATIVASLGILAALTPKEVSGAVVQWEVVSEDPKNFTPELAPTTAVPTPRVDAIGQAGDTIFAGGLFESVTAQGGYPAFARQNFVAFDALTGTLKSEMGVNYTDPVFDGPIWAIETYGDSVFVGGEFSTVNGISRRRLVKLDAATGAVDTSFNAGFSGGIVWDLQMWNGPGSSTPMLVVGGSMSTKLVGLNPTTGVNTGYFNLGIADPLPGAWGGVAVYKMAIDPAGTKLVATGNFQTVLGQSRTRLFIADLTGANATLDPWYYPGFAKPCSSIQPRRIAYLQDVDFSPDGTYFVVTATGQIPLDRPADIWPDGSATYHTVCDAAGRFDLADDQHPVWINYTGGDSIWSTAVTGAAVYVQGHFLWLDNPKGWASHDGGGAVKRRGIGAIDPVTGKALDWNPSKPASIGGKAFLATSMGLWVGSDSLSFDGEQHRGIAFAPLPLVMLGAGDIASCSSLGDEATAELVEANEGVVFTLGDNAYPSATASEFANCYEPSWGVHKARTRPSPGERDYVTTDASGYFGYFGEAAGPVDKGYYSYDVGDWHIVVLNSMCERVGGCGGLSPMIAWLKDDLAANTKKCTLAYFHHPLFSSGEGYNGKMRPAWNALYSAKADIVVSGHSNNYERFARQRPDGTLNNTRGIREFVVGTGGAALAPFGATQPNSEVRNAETFGILKLTLHPSSYEWRFIPQEGAAFTDSGRTDCH
jgi:hypothetical protein